MSSEEKFRAISPAEFFYKYREIAGFANPARALYQTVRELVENALDATDAHGILPSIKILVKRVEEEHEYYRVTVEDNGIGMPPDVVPNAFGKVLFSSKYVLRQSRGMYGLGVKMAVLYGQMTTGRPVEVITSKSEYRRIYYFKLRIDINKNEPVILERGSWRKERDWHGSIVTIVLEGDWGKAKSKVREYVQRTAVVMPYAEIALYTPDGEVLFYNRATTDMPRPPREVKPHPHGVDLELLKAIRDGKQYSTVEEMLIDGFQSIGEATARTLLQLAQIEPGTDPRKLGDDDLLRLVNVMKGFDGFRPPSPLAISPFGQEIMETGLRRMFEPEFVTAVSRKPSTYQGHPFAVEVGLAYGGKVPMSEQDRPILLRYANKIPLLYDEGSDVITTVIKEEVNWDNYMITFPAPLVLLVHVCSTKVPFKGVGKESIADVPEIRREIRLGLNEVLRRLRAHLIAKAKEAEAHRKAMSIIKFMPDVLRSLETISNDSGRDAVNLKALEESLVELIARRTGLPTSKVRELLEAVEVGE
ncbi:MAG: DNA topoisomerase VI subunit B [Desulfurococcaceae archaeon]